MSFVSKNWKIRNASLNHSATKTHQWSLQFISMITNLPPKFKKINQKGNTNNYLYIILVQQSEFFWREIKSTIIWFGENKEFIIVIVIFFHTFQTNDGNFSSTSH